MKIRLSGICYNSLVNGEGMRRVLFTQGCKHNCKGCFNKETHLFNGGTEHDCDDIISDTLSDIMIKGVTFSGGDPFEQALECSYIAKELKRKGLNLWSYSGYTFEELLSSDKEGVKDFLSQLDVLVDGKFEEDLKRDGLRFRGSSNQRIIDVQNSLIENKVVLYMPEIYNK